MTFNEGGEEEGQRSRDLVSRVVDALRRYEFQLALLLAATAVALRVAWVLQGARLQPFVHEMQRVAVSFATTGTLSDAYFVGQGPTTHVGPIMPIMGGLVYRAFGTGTPAAEAVLVAIALAFLVISMLCARQVLKELGVPGEWRLAAMAAAAVLPLNFGLEVRDQRLFEGSFAAALLLLSLVNALKLDRTPNPTWRQFAFPTLIAAILFLLNPGAGLGAYAALGLAALRRAPLKHWLGIAAITAAMTVLVLAPWTLRNERVFGQPIFTRGNFGLEFAIGFHPAAASPADPRKVFVDRLKEIHPSVGEYGKSEVIRLGELAYFEGLAASTRLWISEHPQEAAEITLRHAREFWLPSKWMWQVYDSEARLVEIRMAIVWGTTILALGALAWGLIRHPLGKHLYVACVLLLPSIPYLTVQPIMRYRYIVATLTLFLAAEATFRISKAVTASIRNR